MAEDTRNLAGPALPPVLVRFWIVMAVLTLATIVYTACIAWRYHLPAPYNLPLLWDDLRGMDLRVFASGFAHYGTPQFWTSFNYSFTYPAPLGVVFLAIYQLAHPVRVYLLLCFLVLGIGVAALLRSLLRAGVAPTHAWLFTLTTLLMLWPIWFFLCDANIEGLVVIVATCGTLALLHQRPWLAATLLGVAGAMKFFPLVLLGLLLSKRRYTQFVWAFLVGIALTLVSLQILGPTMAEAQRNINLGFGRVTNQLMFSMLDTAPTFDHSLWLPVRFALVGLDNLLHPVPVAMQMMRTHTVLVAGLRAYLAATAALGTSLYFIRIRKLPMLNQLLALTTCSVLLPPLSVDYTLLHLLLPFSLLCLYAVDIAKGMRQVDGLQQTLLCFVPIFGINSFLNHKYVYATEARTVGLMVLLITVLRYSFPWPRLDTDLIAVTAARTP